MDEKSARPRDAASIGLGLGGGGARGTAHIGVLKALQENDLKPEFIAGTSAGAIIGGLYACGVDLDDLRRALADMNWMNFAGATLSRFGLLSNNEVARVVDHFVSDRRIEDANIPFAALATDISTGEAVVIKKGLLSHALMATSAIPGIFVPVEMDGRLLVDGGLVENVPVSSLRGMGAEICVGVDLNAAHSYERPDNMVEVLLNAMDIAIDTTTRSQLRDADLVIELSLAQYSRTDASDIRELIADGYRATAHKLKALEKIRASRQPSSWQVLEKKFRAWREAMD